MTTTSAPIDIRGRREQLDVSRLALAIKSGVSPAWLAALEAGLQPCESKALDRVLAALEKLEDRFVPYAEVAEHLEVGVTATDGPRSAGNLGLGPTTTEGPEAA